MGPRVCALPVGRSSDHYGDHSVGCSYGGERVGRHNAQRDAVFQAAQQSVLSPRREEPFLMPSGMERPADIYIPNWTAGKDTAIDVSHQSTPALRGEEDSPGSGQRTRAQVRDEDVELLRPLQGAGHPLPAPTGGDPGWLAPPRCQGSDEARQTAGQADREGGGGDSEALLPETRCC